MYGYPEWVSRRLSIPLQKQAETVPCESGLLCPSVVELDVAEQRRAVASARKAFLAAAREAHVFIREGQDYRSREARHCPTDLSSARGAWRFARIALCRWELGRHDGRCDHPAAPARLQPDWLHLHRVICRRMETGHDPGNPFARSPLSSRAYKRRSGLAQRDSELTSR